MKKFSTKFDDLDVIIMGNRCSIQQSEEINCCLEQSPENRLYRPFRYFWATLYKNCHNSGILTSIGYHF